MADPLSLLTRVEAYEAINDIESAGVGSSPDRDPEMVGIWIPAISRRIDELCGPVVSRTVTETYSAHGRDVIHLRTPPAQSITSVTVDGETLDPSGYELDNANRFLSKLYRQSGEWPLGRRNIVAVYSAGRYADTESVDPKFKLAASFVLQGMWNKMAGSWATGGDPFESGGLQSQRMFDELSHVMKRWLADEMRPPMVA